MFFGNKSLQNRLIWQTTLDNRTELDFIRSQTVQFVPSLLINGTTLLEGQLAIMSDVYYHELGIDPGPVGHFYSELRKSFKRIFDNNSRVAVVTPTGETKLIPNTSITASAAEWVNRKKGRLKQLKDGPVEFTVVKRPD